MRVRLREPLKHTICVALWVLTACDFEITTRPSDGAMPDEPPPDILVGTPTSCKQLHAASPMLASGTYPIDPDGDGGDPEISVTCDMVTDGGGWTIIFFPTGADLATAPTTYTTSTPRLLADSQTALLAYRDTAQVAVPGFASFALPPAWRTKTPFDQPGTDMVTSVSVNGGASASSNLRFGYDSFQQNCGDPWLTNERWGRICLTGTEAPFFNSFASVAADYCSSSSAPYTDRMCNVDRRFSIAVR